MILLYKSKAQIVGRHVEEAAAPNANEPNYPFTAYFVNDLLVFLVKKDRKLMSKDLSAFGLEGDYLVVFALVNGKPFERGIVYQS